MEEAEAEEMGGGREWVVLLGRLDGLVELERKGVELLSGGILVVLKSGSGSLVLVLELYCEEWIR